MEPVSLPPDGDVVVAPSIGPLASLTLSGVDVTLVPLDCDEDEVADLGRLISPEERERAARFVRDLHRHRFTVARATLRLQLAERLDLPPTAIEFRYGEHGKPALGGRLAGVLHFNVSHSESMAMYVFSQHPVGCDIERIRPIEELEQIVTHWFARPECAEILAAENREAAFFRYWTAKEAVLKGEGTGLSLLSREFELQPRDGETFRARGIAALSRWTAMRVNAPAGFAAAVAFCRTDAAEVQG